MTTLSTEAEVLALIEELRKLPEGTRIVRDTETTGLDMFGLADRYAKPLGKPGGPDGDLIEADIGPARVCGEAVGIPFGNGIRTFYLPYRHETGDTNLDPVWMRRITDVINERGLTLVNHNIKFDLKMLWADGAMPDEHRVKLEDTMLLAHILDERQERYTLEYLVQFYTDAPMKLKRGPSAYLKEHGLRRYSQIPVSLLGPYAEDDVRSTWKLWKVLYPHLTDATEPWFGDEKLKQVFHTEMEVLWVITWMEIHGVKIDVEKTRAIYKTMDRQFETGMKKIRKMAGDDSLNPFSFPQLKKLWASKGWPQGVDELTGRETFQDMTLFKLLPVDPLDRDKKPLPHPDHPGMKEFISLLVKVRTLQKFKETYLDSYLRLADEAGFLHPSFNQHGTVTGRLSSSAPNFQNIPKTIATGRTALQKAAEDIVQSPVRQIIIPRSPDHRLVEIDFAQQEIRLFLHYVDEPKMRDIIMSGGDVHHFAANEMFRSRGGMPDKAKDPDRYYRARHMAKFINFGTIYGMGARKLGAMFELPWSEAKQYYDDYLAAFPHIKEFIEIVRTKADLAKYVKNCFGRRRRMRLLTPEEKRTGKVRTGVGFTASVRPTDQTADAHKALNAIIQGGAADLVKRSMLRIHVLLRGTNSYLINQIHDSLVFELHVDEMDALLPKICDAMTNWPDLATPYHVPFAVDVSIASWEWSTSAASKV